MAIEIEWDDNATPWLESTLRHFPQFDQRAMKSLGWMLAKEMKAGIKSGAPGGSRYKPLSGIKRRGNGRQRAITSGKAGRFLGKLARAIGYQYKDNDGSLIVGWLSRSAAALGTRIQGGETITVTPKMRAFWAAAGRKNVFPLSKDTKEINVPARPTIEPLKKALTPKMSGYYCSKIDEYLNAQMSSVSHATSKPSSRRVYKVWGEIL